MRQARAARAAPARGRRPAAVACERGAGLSANSAATASERRRNSFPSRVRTRTPSSIGSTVSETERLDSFASPADGHPRGRRPVILRVDERLAGLPGGDGLDGREPRVLAIDAGGTMTDTFVVDRAGRVRGRQGADHSRRRVGRLHGVHARRPRLLGPGGRGRAAADGLRDLLGHGDAEPPAGAQGPPRRPDRDRGHGGLAAARARHPDLPRLSVLRPPARRHAPPQRAARPARADARRARPRRPVRRRGDPPLRGRGARGGRGARRGRRRGHRGQPPLQLPQRLARAAHRGDRRRGRAGHAGVLPPPTSTRCAATSRG